MNGATPVTSPTRSRIPTSSSITTKGISQKRFWRHRNVNSSRIVPAPPAALRRTLMACLFIMLKNDVLSINLLENVTAKHPGGACAPTRAAAQVHRSVPAGHADPARARHRRALGGGRRLEPRHRAPRTADPRATAASAGGARHVRPLLGHRHQPEPHLREAD